MMARPPVLFYFLVWVGCLFFMAAIAVHLAGNGAKGPPGPQGPPITWHKD
jgi:hypothetical protein